MKEEKETWWDIEISDHEKYGLNINYAGKKLVAHLLGDDCQSVLDVGCGNGLVYKAIKEEGKLPSKYKGVDLSSKMIETCQKMYPEVEWEQEDADQLKEENESYDIVLLFHVHESMNSYQQSIKEALRVAKKKVIIVFWKGLTNLDEDIIQEMPYNGWTSFYCAKKFFTFLKEIDYSYAPWLELYCDGFRYNLYFVLDKEHQRTESGTLPK